MKRNRVADALSRLLIRMFGKRTEARAGRYAHPAGPVEPETRCARCGNPLAEHGRYDHACPKPGGRSTFIAGVPDQRTLQTACANCGMPYAQHVNRRGFRYCPKPK